jgi:hypothetical protein
VNDWPGPARPEPRPPNPGRRWAFAVIAFVMAGVLPSIYFLWAGFSDDPTATGSAGSAVAWLVGIAVLIGAVLGTIGWAAGAARIPATRAVLSTLVLLGDGGASPPGLPSSRWA